MSHFYPNLIVEIDPGRHYYLADDLADPDDIDAELSRNPPFQGGPYASHEEAARAMIGARGNPGFMEAMSHASLMACDEWMIRSLRLKIRDLPPADEDAPEP